MSMSPISIGPVWRQAIEAFDGSSNQLPLTEPVDKAALEIGNMAGDAGDFGIVDGLDDDVVADPVDIDLANLLGSGGKGKEGGGECGSRHSSISRGSVCPDRLRTPRVRSIERPRMVDGDPLQYPAEPRETGSPVCRIGMPARRAPSSLPPSSGPSASSPRLNQNSGACICAQSPRVSSLRVPPYLITK